MPFFNVLYALRLTSPFDAAVLERSINEIVRRHEILRTTFAVVDGRYVQVIAPLDRAAAIRRSARARELEEKKETAAHQLIQEELVHSFDLANGPLIRARLVRLAEQEHLLLISMHQVICDGWSLGVFVEELATSTTPSPPEGVAAGAALDPVRGLCALATALAVTFGHRCAARILARAASRSAARDEARHGPCETDDRRFPHGAAGGGRCRRAFRRPPNASAIEEGGTLFMALVAALKTCCCIATRARTTCEWPRNVANRNRPGTEGLIGPLVNTVILRTNLGGDPSPREVMRRVRATTLAAFAHQDLPFEELVETLERERALEPAALAQVMIWLQNAALRPRRAPGTRLLSRRPIQAC